MGARMAELAWPDGPVIETARLRLRPHRLDDLEARIGMTSSPYVMRHFDGVTQSREENWHRLLRYAGHWALLGRGMFVVEDRVSGRYAGEVGLADFHRGLGPDFDPFPEAAWVFDQWAEGQGFATEAAGALIGWHDRRFGARRLVCIIAPANEPSLRVAAKLGFERFGEAVYHDRAVAMLERLALPKACDPR